jgi:hypothetical protein
MDSYEREYSNSYDWGLDCGRDFLSYDEEIEQMTEREAYCEALRMLRLWMKEKHAWGRNADWETLMVIQQYHPQTLQNAMRTFFTPEPLVK